VPLRTFVLPFVLGAPRQGGSSRAEIDEVAGISMPAAYRSVPAASQTARSETRSLACDRSATQWRRGRISVQEKTLTNGRISKQLILPFFVRLSERQRVVARASRNGPPIVSCDSTLVDAVNNAGDHS
jgi:hypothetical protein